MVGRDIAQEFESSEAFQRKYVLVLKDSGWALGVSRVKACPVGGREGGIDSGVIWAGEWRPLQRWVNRIKQAAPTCLLTTLDLDIGHNSIQTSCK